VTGFVCPVCWHSFSDPGALLKHASEAHQAGDGSRGSAEWIAVEVPSSRASAAAAAAAVSAAHAALTAAITALRSTLPPPSSLVLVLHGIGERMSRSGGSADGKKKQPSIWDCCKTFQSLADLQQCKPEKQPATPQPPPPPPPPPSAAPAEHSSRSKAAGRQQSEEGGGAPVLTMTMAEFLEHDSGGGVVISSPRPEPTEALLTRRRPDPHPLPLPPPEDEQQQPPPFRARAAVMSAALCSPKGTLQNCPPTNLPTNLPTLPT
jgi:hypothetical protein